MESVDNNTHSLSPKGNAAPCVPPLLKDDSSFTVKSRIECYQLLAHILEYFYTLEYLLDYSNTFLPCAAQS